jgi:hypothetical protein
MKISELCKMIEDSIRNGKYPLQDQQQKYFSKYVEVINRSESEDLKTSNIKIEVTIQNLYTINNYVPEIQHLPGIIEVDVLDSFKMLCRRVTRLDANSKPGHSKDIATRGK